MVSSPFASVRKDVSSTTNGEWWGPSRGGDVTITVSSNYVDPRMEVNEKLMPPFVSDDGAVPSFVAIWRKGRSVTGSNPDGGVVPPSFDVRREGRVVPGSNPDNGDVPSSVDDGLMPSFVADDGAAPSSFTLWRGVSCHRLES